MTTQPTGWATGRIRILSIVLVAVLAGLAAVVPAQGEAKKKQSKPFKVMTKNVYLGADLSPALGAPDLGAAIDGAGEIYNEIERTNFPERAVPLAKEINKAKPHLVGLQEVALWRVQQPSDGGWTETGGIGGPATEVKYDFLKELTKRLKKYRVVGVQEEFEGELPANVDGDDSTGTGPLAVLGADLDARLTMRDVILARKGGPVKVKDKTLKMDQYDTLYTANIGPVQIEAARGWLSVEAEVEQKKQKKGGKKSGAAGSKKPVKFRFVNTHLEAFGDPTIKEAQAKELIAQGGPLKTKKQVVLVGDLNSGLANPHEIGDGANSGTNGDQLAFKALKGFGMKDYGAVQSCCYPSELDDPKFKFDHTVDHVLVKPKGKLIKSDVTGDDKSQRTPSGLWPSDHGGVWSKLKLFK